MKLSSDWVTRVCRDETEIAKLPGMAIGFGVVAGASYYFEHNWTTNPIALGLAFVIGVLATHGLSTGVRRLRRKRGISSS